MTRDELARHLYIQDGNNANQWQRDRRAFEWDDGLASEGDTHDCLARADRMIANGEGRPS